jgi:hypothetical protein
MWCPAPVDGRQGTFSVGCAGLEEAVQRDTRAIGV